MIFDVNVHDPLDLAQAVIPAMTAAGEGWIVNLSSGTTRPHAGPPFQRGVLGSTIGIYGASKAALDRITNGLAAELYGTGIRVNSVEPRSAVLSEGAAELVGAKLRPVTAKLQAFVDAGVRHFVFMPAPGTGDADDTVRRLLDEVLPSLVVPT